MHIDTTHPKFDPALELLCSLPCMPKMVRISSLCEDFCVKHQSDIRRLASRLEACGHKIEIHQKGKDIGYCIGVTRRGWSFSQAAGESYWRSVYQQNTTAQVA